MIKHILLATDLSANSHVIAEKAKNMAKMYKAKLSIVYVLEYRPVVYGGGEFALPIDTELMAVFEKKARDSLAQLGKDLNVAEEDQYFAMDSVKQAVVDLAERLGVDLIVIGSHGTHGPALLLGSVANAILHAAKCNVLAVRL